MTGNLTVPNVILNANPAQILFTPSGSTKAGNIYQSGDSLVLAASGVANYITLNLNSGLATVSADPTAALGIATKQYVDSHAAVPALPTQQILTASSGTYSRPANCRRIEVTMVGGGGGGSGGGGGGAGTAGGDTTFSTFTANGAGANPNYYQSGNPGGSSGGQLNLSGGWGCDATPPNASGPNEGGMGGATIFGGAGGGGLARLGNNASANTGAGGGGGGGPAGLNSGAGGSSGGAVMGFINSPAATYPYGVGMGGSPGAGVSGGNQGGYGAAGIIIVKEYY
jgi:hypothetical protein